MYRYVCKEDQDIYHSQDHPADLLTMSSPHTEHANRARVEKRRSQSADGQSTAGPCDKKSRQTKTSGGRLTNTDVAKFIHKSKISTYNELLAAAETRVEGGQNDLSDFVFNRNEKVLQELITKTWQMASAKSKLSANKKSCYDAVKECLDEPCHDGCNGEWLTCATEVLALNNIQVENFTASIRELLQKGRGKHRNIFISGPANCAKTFMLKPLRTIFNDKVFENPTNHKYAWLGADEAHMMLLNDFRWNREIITWDNLLRLLDGDIVKLPAPKNLQSEDVIIKRSIPIFATGRSIPIFATGKSTPTYRGSYNSTCDVETDMMNARWKTFGFSHVFPERAQKHVPHLVFAEEIQEK